MNARLSKEGQDGEGGVPPLGTKQPFVLFYQMHVFNTCFKKHSEISKL